MSTFYHTPDNIILINNTSFPLSFFLTVEPAYILPSGMITQYYEQGVIHYASTGTTEYEYSIPWTAGDGYIANEATYISAYTDYLNTPVSLSDAKNSKLSDLEEYANTIKLSHIIFIGNEYPTDSIFLTKLINEDLTYKRATVLPLNYYVNDIDYNQIPTASLAELEYIIDGIVNFYYQVDKNEDIHRLAINGLGSISAVQDYDYTTGWPSVPYNPNLAFSASYYSSIDADFSLGSHTGIPVGGATILNHKLDLAHSDVRYLDYNAHLNADFQQIGTISFILIPNYSGSPINDQVFLLVTEADSSVTNRIQITHTAYGYIILNYNDLEIPLGPWDPTADQEYYFILHYDITNGNTFLKIDNVTLGGVLDYTGTRSATIGLLRIGNTWDSYNSLPSNFSMTDLHICDN